jgi:hypothetical protein
MLEVLVPVTQIANLVVVDLTMANVLEPPLHSSWLVDVGGAKQLLATIAPRPYVGRMLNLSRGPSKLVFLHQI